MAIMYPLDIENYNYTKSEKFLYDEFKTKLPDKYHVFYSVRWFEVEDGERVDSESDFIVYDPSFGFIAIEVKGGKDILLDGSQWSLLEYNEDGDLEKRPLKCSPYTQAEKSMRHFYKYFHQEYHQSFNGTYGFAVAFPWYSADSIISSSSPKEVTIDMNDLSSLPQKINSIFHYWKNKRNLTIPFSAEQRQRFISLINKRISLSAAAGALIPIKEKEFKKINAIQDSILDALHNYPELRFVGGAGTGKTYIGAKKALRDSEAGKKVLFTCCSEELANYVRTEILHDNPNITCLNYENLMKSLLDEEYSRIVELGLGFFDAVEDLSEKQKFDSVVVDEAQDYDVDMGLAMRALLRHPFTTFYVFFDENQNVFSKDFENSFAIEYPPIILRYNIRNTGRIYENAIEKTGLGLETVASTLLGVEPEYSDYRNATQCKKALTNIVNRLTQKEYVPSGAITILSNLSYEESILQNEDAVGALRIDKSKKSGIINGEEIRFRTTTDYKGLESDIIIFLNHVLPGVTPTKKDNCAQYVALTRARYYLYVMNVNIG